MDVKERGLSAALAVAQSVPGSEPEADMKHADEREFDAMAAPAAVRNARLFAMVGKFVEGAKRRFAPSFDPSQLNARLRRDAGIDEIEVERRKAVLAPLIR